MIPDIIDCYRSEHYEYFIAISTAMRSLFATYIQDPINDDELAFDLELDSTYKVFDL